MTDGAMMTETIKVKGHGGHELDAYHARPAGDGPFPGVVVIQHIFGVDEWIQEVCRRLAHHGYEALAPDLYSRIGPLGPGGVDVYAAQLRERGGLNDAVVTGDLQGTADALRSGALSNGRVGTIGFCMGGRFAFLAACRVNGLDAAVDCWGGGVAPAEAQPNRTPPIELAASMSAPLLGIFGNDDRSPDPDEVNRTEATLRGLGKAHEFHRYDGAGHGFFNWWSTTAYRPEQANDAWTKVWSFFETHLQAPVASGAAAGSR